MAENPKANHKTQIDRTGVNWDTDPEGDADRASRVTKKDGPSNRVPTRGIKTLGGGDHGKIDKGVKVVKR